MLSPGLLKSRFSATWILWRRRSIWIQWFSRKLLNRQPLIVHRPCPDQG